jgi:hypothetical protein
MITHITHDSTCNYSDLEKLIEQRNDLPRLRLVARKALRELERLGAAENKIYHALKMELERK